MFKSLQKFFLWLCWRQIPKQWKLKILILIRKLEEIYSPDPIRFDQNVLNPAALKSWNPDPVHLCNTGEQRLPESLFQTPTALLFPKFFNPGPDTGPAILQIWESDSCSDSGYNHRSNRNLLMSLPKKWLHRLLLLPKWKSDSGSGPDFHKFLTPGPGPGPGPKEKRRIQPESTSAFRRRSYLCWLARSANHCCQISKIFIANFHKKNLKVAKIGQKSWWKAAKSENYLKTSTVTEKVSLSIP